MMFNSIDLILKWADDVGDLMDSEICSAFPFDSSMGQHTLLSMLIILATISIAYSNPNTNVGVIEGFYWSADQAVNNQSGSYSFQQRLQLISLLKENNLGAYWYVPQLVDTLELWNSSQLSEWKKTASFAETNKVDLIYGLRPGWLSTDFTGIETRLKQIRSAGIKYYTLNFDDAEGVATSEQQLREVDLVAHLNSTVPTMKLWGFTPYAYYKLSTFATPAAWASGLTEVDSIASQVPMIFTGLSITPSTMSTSQFPPLTSSRPMKFWDNWIAVDTDTRIAWGMIDGRVDAELFTSSYGVMLNLAYPLERSIHHIYCLGTVAKDQGTCNVTAISFKWASWLSKHGFLHQNQTISDVAGGLKDAITQDQTFTSISDMEDAYPSLKTIFSTPPVQIDDVSPGSASSSLVLSVSSILFTSLVIGIAMLLL